MKETSIPNVFEENGKIFTRSVDCRSVYGELVVEKGNSCYRLFSPLRSKLASALRLGLKADLKDDNYVLYLGAGAGTTASHISDSVSSGVIYAVEISPVPFIKLMSVCEIKKNVLPILQDAQKPKLFAPFIERVDLIYQDVSQPNQVDIFINNMDFFSPKSGILMLKSFSLRSDHTPDNEIRKIKKAFDVTQVKDISRFHKGHLAVVVKN
ncbi:MAG: fibrillarin-like rRNA/tRNA 2'-O-methyltransferase [Thermoplasmatales archaeon]